MKFAALLAASAASMLAVPAIAQDNRDPSQDFNGPYISIGGGASLQGSDRGESLIFDTDQDGTYGDQVTTVGGADAFGPGFCNGVARTTNPADGCASYRSLYERLDAVERDTHVHIHKENHVLFPAAIALAER